MEIEDFIPKWTDAVKSADEKKIESTIHEYKFPEYQYDARIKYFKEHYKLDFSMLHNGVVTEGHNWNTRYFRRDVPEHFCDTCNTLEKEEAYLAVTNGGEVFNSFKDALWGHFKIAHPEILCAFDDIVA